MDGEYVRLCLNLHSNPCSVESPIGGVAGKLVYLSVTLASLSELDPWTESSLPWMRMYVFSILDGGALSRWSAMWIALMQEKVLRGASHAVRQCDAIRVLLEYVAPHCWHVHV